MLAQFFPAPAKTTLDADTTDDVLFNGDKPDSLPLSSPELHPDELKGASI